MSDILALAGRASVCAVHSNKCFGSTESLAGCSGRRCFV